MTTDNKYRFNKECDTALSELYGETNTVSEKIDILDKILGGKSNFYGLENMTPERAENAKLGCLEYEYLINQGLIIPTLA